MQESDKKTKAENNTEDVLKGLEHLLNELPGDDESGLFDDPEEEVYRPGPWKGLDWVSKAQALNEMERYREAIQQCDEALSINPGDAKALYVKGEAFRGIGNQRKALECYTKAVRGRPNDEEIWYAAGIVLKQMGKLDEALVAFEKATEYGDTHHDAWYEKAVVLRLLGRHEESRKCLEKAFRDYPLGNGDSPEQNGKPEPPSMGDPETDGTSHDDEEEEEEGGDLDNLDALMGDLMVDHEKSSDPDESIPFDLDDEKVLLSTLNQSLNIQQIRSLVKMPLVICYKKVRKLEELGLLRRVKVEVVGTDNKKRIGYYRTNMKRVKLYSNQGKLKLGVEFMQLIPKTEEKIDPKV
jgi:tetratricopeptide (TPR) repeat protein